VDHLKEKIGMEISAKKRLAKYKSPKFFLPSKIPAKSKEQIITQWVITQWASPTRTARAEAAS
jgi:hypothetical protein